MVRYEMIQKAAWFTPLSNDRWGLVINWIGDVGQAKTAMLERMAASYGFECQVVLAGLREPSDFIGLPCPMVDPTTGERYTEYYAPQFVSKANRAKNGAVIYLDEFNHATPNVQGAAQRMLLEGIVGDTSLAPHVRFVISVNPPEQAYTAGGTTLSIALANRVAHIQWQSLRPSDWKEFMFSTIGEAGKPIEVKRESASDIEATVRKQWPQVYAQAVAQATTFCNMKVDSFNNIPAPGSSASSGAFPTPRSWEFATRALASSRIHGLTNEETMIFVEGFIGAGAATEFFTWLESADLPDPIDILDRKVTFTSDLARIDRTMAVIESCLAVILGMAPGTERDMRVSVFADLLANESNYTRDIVLDAARRMFMKNKTSPGFIPKAVLSKSEFVKNVLVNSGDFIAFAQSI